LTALVFAVATFVSTVLGGLFALHRRQHIYLVMGFASGILVTTALVDLLPHALALGGPVSASRVLVDAALGFLGFYALDRLVHHGAAGHKDHAERIFGGIGALGLTIHSLLDGVAIGGAFRASRSIGVIVGAAVLAHDFGDGVSTVGFVLGSRAALRASVAWLLADAIAPVLGVWAASWAAIPPHLVGHLLGFCAGSFIFIGAAHMLPEAAQHGNRRWLGILVAAGSGLVFAVTRLAEAEVR
jgi:zinc transporter ZupT